MLRLAVDNGAVPAAQGRRKAQLARVHVAKKALGLADDDYRAVIERVTGHRSAADCDDRQLAMLIAEFERLGFVARAGYQPARASHPVARKARAMWISLHQLGAIDDASEKALEAFGRRQLRVERLQWADQSQGFRMIEALKAMAERHGWDQVVPARASQTERVRLLRDRLVGAQIAALAALGVELSGPIAGDRAGWSTRMLEGAAQQLADRLRAARAG